MKPSTLLRLFSAAVVLFPVVADALEMPQTKLGLWEIRTQNSYDGAALTAVPTTQICLNTASMESVKRSEESGKKSCSKNELRRDGSKWVTNSVCKIGGSAVTSQVTREFSGENAYHDDMSSAFDPPMAGLARSHVVMDGKWLGPCK